MEMTTRPMTDVERRQLRAAVSADDSVGHWIINVGFGAALLMLPTLLLASLLGQKHLQHVLLPVAAVIGGGAGLLLQFKLHRLLAAAQGSTRADIRNGVVEEVEASVEAVVSIPEFEDEGPALFLAVAPNATLFLQGQYLYGVDEKGELRSRVRIARAPLSRTVLAFGSSGERVTSTTALPPGLYDQLPEDGELVPLGLQETLARHARGKSAVV